MSVPALLWAVRKRLWDQIPELPQRTIDVTIHQDGQPPPAVGDLFIGIHMLGWQPGDIRNEVMMGLDETYRIGITVTQRISSKPMDRQKDFLMDQWFGIDNWVRKSLLIHQNYDILSDASLMIAQRYPGATAANTTFQEPFRWEGSDAAPRVVDGLWFTAEQDAMAGLVLQTRYGRARRLQPSANMI